MRNTLNTGAGKAFKMYSEEQTAYYQRKHKHYNEWLMDNDRPFDQAYPGFPEDVELLKKLEENENSSMQ